MTDAERDERDKHLAILNQGVEIWNQWRVDNPCVKPNLVEADLQNANLSHANLIGANLTSATLTGANLTSATLTGADLTEANLCGAPLHDAYFCGAILIKADLTGANLREADLREADLTNADLKVADFTEANLTDTHLTGANLNGANFTGACVVGIRCERKAMRGKYQGIRGIDSCYGDAIFKRDAQDQDYIDTRASRPRTPTQRLWFWVWGLSDYGRSLTAVGVFALVMVLGFGLVYTFHPYMPDDIIHCDKSHKFTWFTPFYFSFVTYTTLGFGDVTAKNACGEIFVTAEVVLGYITLGLLLAILANTVARRS